jgi:hypothetical protein
MPTPGPVRRGRTSTQVGGVVIRRGRVREATPPAPPIVLGQATGVLEPDHGGTGTSLIFPDGSIVFAGAGGIYASDVRLVWDASNGRLGIGTATPTAPVEINVPGLGAANMTGLRLTNNAPATGAATLQFSPRLTFRGQAWDTDGAGASVTNRVALYARMLTGSATGAFLAVSDDSNGAGSFTDQFYLGSASAGGTPDFRIRDGNIIFRNAGRGISFVTAPLTDTFDANFLISGDVSGGRNRIKFTAVNGYVFVEGNNFGTGAGVVPMMDFRGFDDSTSSPIVQLRLRGTPGGSVAAGFGSRILAQANSSTTADQDQGAIDVVWGDHTHASRSGDLVVRLVHSAAALAEKFRLRSSGLLTFGGITSSEPALKPNAAVVEVKLADDSDFAELKAFALRVSDGAFLLRSSVALDDGAGADVGTLTNAPAAGDPTKWIPIDDNGTTRFIPAW